MHYKIRLESANLRFCLQKLGESNKHTRRVRLTSMTAALSPAVCIWAYSHHVALGCFSAAEFFMDFVLQDKGIPFYPIRSDVGAQRSLWHQSTLHSHSVLKGMQRMRLQNGVSLILVLRHLSPYGGKKKMEKEQDSTFQRNSKPGSCVTQGTT